jgi:hypothetical protein
MASAAQSAQSAAPAAMGNVPVGILAHAEHVPWGLGWPKGRYRCRLAMRQLVSKGEAHAPGWGRGGWHTIRCPYPHTTVLIPNTMPY